MELQELYALMDRFSATGLTSLEWEQDGTRLALKKESPAAAPLPPPVSAPEPEPEDLVTAPLVGVFYAASSPDAEPFVKVGDQVKKGQILGIIEAMKLMNEIESEYDGIVEAILVKNEDVVEFGQPLFRIR